jgi:integrase
MRARRKRPNFKPYAVGQYRLGWLVDQFCVVWYDEGGRRRHRLGVATEEEARTELHSFARSHLKYKNEPTETVKAIQQQYVAQKEADGEDSRKSKWLWPALGPVFGHMRPVDITTKHCKEYAAARAALGRKQRTIYGELQTLRIWLNWAVKKKLLPLDQLPTIWLPQMPDPRDRHLTREELAKLLSAAELPHIRLFIVLAISTAARKTAILQLTWNRIDFDRGLIHLHDPEQRRTKKGRALVPMNGSARAALTEAREGAATDHVIEWAGQPVLDIKRGLSTALKKAGLKLKGDGAHTLRHSAAVMMAEAGIPMSEISQYLGHKNTDVTERVYARYSPTYLAKAASSLELPPVQIQISDRRLR